jgi:hypothetical protein
MTRVRVRQLRLHAPDDAAVRRGAWLIEDALRTATLAGADEPRLYLIRRLDLGTFRDDVAPQTLALAIERRVALLRAAAVPAAAADAERAVAVWFPDEPTAIAAVAARRAAGASVEAWFWRQVAGGAATQVEVGAALIACVVAAAATAAGPAAVALTVAAIEDARAGALLALLAPVDGPALLARTLPGAAVGRRAVPTDRASDAALLASLPVRWRARLVMWATRWQGDARAIWLAVLARIAASGAVAAPAVAVADAIALVSAAIAVGADAITAPDRPAAPRTVREPDLAPDAAAAPAATVAPQPGHGEPDEVVAGVRAAAVIGPRAPQREAAPEVIAAAIAEPVAAAPIAPIAQPITQPRDADADPTVRSSVAGVLLLTRALAELGIARWLDAHPWAAAQGFAARLLAAVAVAHGASLDDPIVHALAPAGLDGPDGPFVVPARWRPLIARRAAHRHRAPAGEVILAGQMPVAAWPHGALGLPARRHPAPVDDRPWAILAWQRALDRWLRCYARLELGEVIARPGALAATPTHVTIAFPLRAIDLRVRTSGLDIDPGWVPWLGRVVRFAYVEGQP